jgi:hypothetical protein
MYPEIDTFMLFLLETLDCIALIIFDLFYYQIKNQISLWRILFFSKDTILRDLNKLLVDTWYLTQHVMSGWTDIPGNIHVCLYGIWIFPSGKRKNGHFEIRLYVDVNQKP